MSHYIVPLVINSLIAFRADTHTHTYGHMDVVDKSSCNKLGTGQPAAGIHLV